MSKSRPPLAGVTRKHLARAEREALMQKWIVGGTIVIAVLIVGLLGYGWLDQNVLQLRRPVAKVGTVEISTEKFQKAVRYDRYQQIRQYFQIAQYVEFAQSFGADPQTISFYQQQAQQITQTLEQPETLGQKTLDRLVKEEIIRQEAAKRGITVSAEEVEKAFQEAFGYYANGTPTSPPSPTFAPTHTPAPTATGAPTETPTPTLEPSLTPTQGPSETPFPTATPYTLEGFQKRKEEHLAELLKTTGLSEADLRAIFEMDLLRKKLQEAVGSDVANEMPTAHARHILIEVEGENKEDPEALAAAEAKAKDLIKQLQEGADFAELAKAHSADTSNKDTGGDLGTADQGAYVIEFDTVVFNEPLGLYPQPVKTQFGYHIIDILERGSRALDASELEQKQSETFNTWLDAQRQQTGFVEEISGWQLHVPSHPTIQDVIDAQPTATPGPTTAVPSTTPAGTAVATTSP